MKRIYIFTVLFPPLALLVFIAADVYRKGEFPPMSLLLSIVGIAYVITIVPAWVSAAVDWGLANTPVRLVGTMAVATAAALIIARYLGHVMPSWKDILLVALMGAIPAGVCSFLSSEKQKECMDS